MDAIMKLVGKSGEDVSAKDPIIAGPVGAYKAQEETGLRKSRGALAERAAAEGLNPGGAGSGAFDSALQAQQEQGARDVGQFQGNLMYGENDARRNALMRALGLGTQNQQFYDTMGMNIGNNEGMMNNEIMRLLAGG